MASGLSLRLRLNLLLAGVMGLFIAALLWSQIDATRDSVREEITASNRVATQLLERISWIVSRGGPEAMLAFLEQLGRVRANDISLVDAQGQVRYRSPVPTYKQGREAPDWFNALVVPPLQRQVIEVAGGRLTIEANPSRAILDGWDALLGLAGLALLALLALSAAVFWAVGRTLQPFGQITRALNELQQGHFQTRLPPLPGREAHLIGEAVNRLGGAIEAELAERLRAFQAERALAESREWGQHVQARLEAERQEIAAELHDELGQSVTAMRALARSLMARLPEADTTGREAARLIDQEAAQLYDAMHGLIPRLTPMSLSPLGLADALGDLAASLRQRHPTWTWVAALAPTPEAVAPAVALTAYRVAQEAMNNAVKHSGGRQIHLSLAVDTDQALCLTVDDDGCGLPPEGQRAARFGLGSLQQRVSAQGGQFSAQRRPEGGSRVQARWPHAAWAEPLAGSASGDDGGLAATPPPHAP